MFWPDVLRIANGMVPTLVLGMFGALCGLGGSLFSAHFHDRPRRRAMFRRRS